MDSRTPRVLLPLIGADLFDRVIPELVKSAIDYKSVARQYFDYYDTMLGAYRSATVSVIETQYLQELAHRLKQFFENNKTSIHSFDRTAIQRMDSFEEQYCFDLANFVQNCIPDSGKNEFYETF